MNMQMVGLMDHDGWISGLMAKWVWAWRFVFLVRYAVLGGWFNFLGWVAWFSGLAALNFWSGLILWAVAVSLWADLQFWVDDFNIWMFDFLGLIWFAGPGLFSPCSVEAGFWSALVLYIRSLEGHICWSWLWACCICFTFSSWFSVIFSHGLSEQLWRN